VTNALLSVFPVDRSQAMRMWPREYWPTDLMALTAAVRSAQMQVAYAPFSMLQPEYMVPSLVLRAAPTAKLLYGQ